jgi:hypothetical protein
VTFCVDTHEITNLDSSVLATQHFFFQFYVKPIHTLNLALVLAWKQVPGEVLDIGLFKVNLEFSFSIPGLFQTWDSNNPGFEKLNSRSEPGFEKLNIRSEPGFEKQNSRSYLDLNLNFTSFRQSSVGNQTWFW